MPLPFRRLTALLCLIWLGTSAYAEAPLQTIGRLDLPRYQGVWYELAKFPNWFQKKCVGETRAEYRARDNGQIQVINRCRQADGDMAEAIGSARLVGETGSPRLKVRFAPAWLAFIPAVWGDYWVIDLDPDYQLAAVSEPGRDYLWILSRTPQIPPARYQALLARLAAQGLDISRLEITPQAP